MIFGDLIQLTLAIIAAIGAIFAFLNIRSNNRQIALQQNQWEYSAKPVFRIIKLYHINSSFEWAVFFENVNTVYHKIDRVSFSSSDVGISDTAYHGKFKQKSGEVVEYYHDNVIILSPKTNDFIVGVIKLEGVDLIGNRFEVFSPDIKFKNGYIENTYSLDHKYFTLK